VKLRSHYRNNPAQNSVQDLNGCVQQTFSPELILSRQEYDRST